MNKYYGNDNFNLKNAYDDCKQIFESITDNESYQKADSGVVMYYSNEIMYALEKALEERPHGEWIPVSERLPDDLEPVNITWINHEPEPYYKEIKDKPFTATGVYFNGQWYWWSTLCTDILAEYSHSFDDIIDTAIEVIAWQPLPEPYKADMRGKEE